MLAAALLAFAWTMPHRLNRSGRANDDSDDAIVGMFPGV
jgi:heme O synthase-like polyprenyltransferase